MAKEEPGKRDCKATMADCVLYARRRQKRPEMTKKCVAAALLSIVLVFSPISCSFFYGVDIGGRRLENLPMSLSRRLPKRHKHAWSRRSTSDLSGKQRNGSQKQDDAASCCDDMQREDTLHGTRSIGDSHVVPRLFKRRQLDGL